MPTRHVLLGAAFALVAASPTLAAPAEPVGTWLTEDGGSRVRIARCGSGYCATILWTKENGQKDVNNPDGAKRDRPMVGVQIVSNAVASGPDQWSGQLYNPRDGKTYSGKFQIKDEERLSLTGCALAGLICKSQIWTRAR